MMIFRAHGTVLTRVKIFFKTFFCGASSSTRTKIRYRTLGGKISSISHFKLRRALTRLQLFLSARVVGITNHAVAETPVCAVHTIVRASPSFLLHQSFKHSCYTSQQGFVQFLVQIDADLHIRIV